MGARRTRNTTAQQWRHETLDLEDGDRLFWTVDDNHRRGPTILAVASQKHGPYWVPEGRDAIKAAGHPDGQLRAMHDPPEDALSNAG